MTDCCVSPPSIGTWKIYVRMPIYYPNRIKYNWNDGTGQQIIEGDNYIITMLYPNAGKYRIYYQWYYTTCGGDRGNATNVVEADLIDYRFIPGGSTGENYFTYQSSENSGFIWFVSGCSTPGLIPIIINECGSNCGTGWSSYSIQKISEYSEQKYTLKIYNKGLLVYAETRSAKPTVTLMPEQCLQGNQKEFVRDYQNNSPKDYCLQEINGNRTLLLLMSHYTDQYSSKGIYIPIPLAYKSSDEKCALAPIFEVECVPCKKCPENTCEVFCGDQICCYDFNGVAVDSFPIEELCL